MKNFISNLFNKNSYKTLFLIDILYMKDINAIYKFNNGDYIIRQLKTLLETKIKFDIKHELERKTLINISNTHADVFELTIYDNLEIDEILLIKDIVFKNITSHNFKLLDKKTLINIDVTIGCSKSDDNQIKIYAEKALHNAKLNYVHYMFYDSYLYKNESVSENLVKILNYSIDNNLVEPYFQAIVDNETEEIEKYEVLMRIFDQNGNIILPNAFIQKAKKCRLYTKLMEILIDKTINYILKYKINVSINLNYTDIINSNIKKALISKIQKNNVGKYITLEILESEKVSNFNIVNDFITSVNILGVKIAIDDFGTGFSNYENILNLNIDYIKIDGSLIKKIDEVIYLNLIKSIVLFCKQQNIKIVAEFVSDLKILRYVKNIQIDYSQGYYISKPKSISEIILERENEKRTKKNN
ncbi:EAL domain-containing protein [Malaciobacter pacificus]|uniref:EAL domain-containing protein n=1 Tax=Malaciobacter pacificus TaxID=1080223 RepID=UPI0010296CC2|nr:EAL domain-containing protein [Malaciobacter pacificus]